MQVSFQKHYIHFTPVDYFKPYLWFYKYILFILGGGTFSFRAVNWTKVVKALKDEMIAWLICVSRQEKLHKSVEQLMVKLVNF